MTTVCVRTGWRLGLAFVCAAASGCYIPGGGWTMRTGLDVRRYHKPSAFLELVDTRWDEYNRVAELNLMGGAIDPRTVVTPWFLPNGGTMMLPPGANGAPPPQPTTTSPEGTGDGNGREPNPLPGTPVETLPPPPGAGPTAQNDDIQLRGPGMQRPVPEADVDAEAAGTDDEADDQESRSAVNGTFSSYRRAPWSNAASPGATKNRIQPASGGPIDSYRRPTASRLFSPNR